MKASLLVAVLAGVLVITAGCKKEAPPASTAPGDTAAAEKAAADKLAAEKAAAEKAAAEKAAAEKVAAETNAQSLLDQVIQYIKDNKFDLAEQGLQKLEGTQGLSTSFMDKTKAARTSLTAAKAVGGVKLP